MEKAEEEVDERQETPPPPVVPLTPSYRIRSMIRQNSAKIGAVAEGVVLPMNKRSLKRTSATEDELDGIDLESQLPTKRKIDVPVKQFPIFIVTISIIQVLIFIFGGEKAWLIFCYDPFRRHELWRFFTEMLVHKTLSHLLGNVIFQLILGLLLEIVHHWQRISAVYMAGVLGGSLAVTVLDPQRYSLGASAGVYGLLLAHLATIILNWDQMDCKICRVFWLLAYIGYDAGSTIYSKLFLHVDSQVSHAGHFGGALAGFIAAVFVLRNFEKLAWEKTFQNVLCVMSAVLLFLVVIINVSFPSHYLPSEFNFNYMETFLRYIFQLLHDSPEWPELQKTCLEDDECAAVYQEFFNNTLQVFIG